jgi:hypothetical protein
MPHAKAQKPGISGDKRKGSGTDLLDILMLVIFVIGSALTYLLVIACEDLMEKRS